MEHDSMKKKRPKTIWLLIVFLGWVFAKQADALVFYSSNANYLFFTAIGMPYFHFLLVLPTVLLGGFAVWYLLRPEPKGLLVALGFLMFIALSTIIETWFISGDLETAKQAYLTYRESRGLPLHLDVIDRMYSMQTITMFVAIFLAILAVCTILLLRKREYFHRSA
jgi:cbb3-type cytochrome oxidase subunit 3